MDHATTCPVFTRHALLYCRLPGRGSSLCQCVEGTLDVLALVVLGSFSNRAEGLAVAEAAAAILLDVDGALTVSGADLNSVALFSGKGEEGAVVGGFDQGHLSVCGALSGLFILLGMPRGIVNHWAQVIRG